MSMRIAADADYAPAHRNLGVLLDLYLGDPAAALPEMERYKALTAEDKPVELVDRRTARTHRCQGRRRRRRRPPAPDPQAPDASAADHGGPT